MATTLRLTKKLPNSINYGGILTVFGRNFSTDVELIQNPTNLGSFKRGTGGRSSFNGIVATVFGCSGFMGKYVCNRLGKIGTQLILPYRGAAYDVLPLKLMGDLGQVLFTPFYLRDEESIRKAVRYSNVVINLVGRDHDTLGFKFDDVHVEGARRLARISREMGVRDFIHLSSLNVSEYPEEYMIKGGSKFLSSKWHGEQAVREEFPDAIIIRPADVYGQEDRFLRYFTRAHRHQGSFMPLYKKGEETAKQPVYVGDVAAAITAAARDARIARGKIYQAVGPKRYLLSELLDWFHRIQRRTLEEWGYRRYDMRFDLLFQMRVTVTPYLTWTTPMGDIHWEHIERECHNDVIDRSIPTLEDLGITLTHMEDQVPWELRTTRLYSYYDEELGEFEKPAPPKSISLEMF